MRNPSNLPNSADLKRLMQSLAALDAIVSPEWEFRYFSYDSKWFSNEQLGSIRNGCGDDVFVLFKDSGCFLKGFSHEYHNTALSSETLYRLVPHVFAEAVTEPAFSPESVTYCLWHVSDGDGWKASAPIGETDADAFFLLDCLDGKPKTYLDFAQGYYELDLNTDIVNAIYDHQPVSEPMARKLNPEIEFSKLAIDLAGIGYPVAV